MLEKKCNLYIVHMICKTNMKRVEANKYSNKMIRYFFIMIFQPTSDRLPFRLNVECIFNDRIFIDNKDFIL